MDFLFRQPVLLKHQMRLCVLLASLPLFSACAEWTQQVITLRPGWNAVWLEVTPEPNDIETVFQSLPVKSVWRYYSEEASARYIDDATTQGLKPDPERWLTWMPGQASGSVLKSLQKIHGGTAYLIESQGTGNVTWTVTGRAVVENLSWLNASYSLTGLCIDPASPVTFAQFFTGSTAHLSADIRRIQADGTWATIPTSTQIQRGEAYWIFSNGISSFQGQGSVEVDDRGLLDYGSTVVEQSVTLCNNTASNASFTLSLVGATPPVGVLSGGEVQLSLWRDGSSLTYGWEPLTSVKTVTVLANTKKVVRLAIRRADMPGQGVDHPFHTILRVAGLNLCSNIGVVADGYAAAGGGGGVASRNAGLWVGQCVLRNVNEPAGASPNTLQPTATEASLRLLLRVAANGSVSLVREATILWLDGLTDVNGNVTEAGRYLVAASDAELAQYQSTYGAVGTGRLKGATVRDGKAAARRISSVGFSFTTPQAMSGTFHPSTGVLTGTVTIGYDDDLNPYKHRFHPDHDNMDSRYASKLPEGQENFTISRQITLTFQNTDPENLRLPGWGDALAGGTYSETINGLHRSPVQVTGTFRLTKVVSF